MTNYKMYFHNIQEWQRDFNRRIIMKKQSLKQPLKETLMKIGGKHLLKEWKDDYDDLEQYLDELAAYIKVLKPTIAGLKFNIEPMSGSWVWENNKTGIYATLGWEGMKGVPIETEDGEVLKKLRYNPKYDLKTDAKWYVSNMKRYLPKIVKEYMK